MPAMPRCNAKAQKIAEAIMGTPPSLRADKKKKSSSQAHEESNSAFINTEKSY